MSSIFTGPSPRLSNSVGISASFLGPVGVGGFFSWDAVDRCFSGGGATGMMGRGPARRSWGRRCPRPGRRSPRSRTRVSVMVGTEGERGVSGGVGAVSAARVGAPGGGGGVCSVLRCGVGSTGRVAAAGGVAFSGGREGVVGGAGSAILGIGAEGVATEGTGVPVEEGGTDGTVDLSVVSTGSAGLCCARPSSGPGRGLVSSTGILRSTGGSGLVERCDEDAEPLPCCCTSCTI